MFSQIEACPLCANPHSTKYLEVKDHSVSQELFHLIMCDNCSFVYTNPRPDDHDLDKYYDSENYISHANQNRNFLDLIYVTVRNIMLRSKESWVYNSLGFKGRVLDYGCGTGAFIQHLQNNHWEVLGIEPNARAKSIANDKTNHQVYQSIDSLPVTAFDAITLWHVLEHIPDFNEKITQLASLLKTTGFMFVAVPNCNSYDANYYREYWAGFDVPRHVSHFTPETMKLLVKKHRLQLINMTPLKFDAYYISILSEKYRKGSIFNAVIQAFRSNQKARRNNQNYSSMVYVLGK